MYVLPPPVSSTDSVAAVGGTTDKAFIAQMVERKTLNLVVVGSIPTEGAFCTVAGSIPTRQRVQY